MKKLSMRKLSLLGLVLMAASAVTAAVIPANSERKIPNGVAIPSTGGDDQQLTCIPEDGQDQCTATDPQFTSTTENGGGANQTDGSSITPNSSAGVHSSVSPE